MITLETMAPGERGEIIGIEACAETCCGCRSQEDKRQSFGRAEEMGLMIGRQVEMLSNGGGLVLVQVDGSRIAIDPAMAMKIRIRIYA